VVDDETFILETAREVLRDKGYRVHTAAGGDEALQQIDENGDVDAVITDLRMPNMDGLDLIRTLRAQHPNLPIIAASGVADGQSEEALTAGAHTFLAKPFDEDTLQKALQEALHASDEATA
jgi:CheY-like chemotaxis protein